jgi:hypothetical protein
MLTIIEDADDAETCYVFDKDPDCGGAEEEAEGVVRCVWV